MIRKANIDDFRREYIIENHPINREFLEKRRIREVFIFEKGTKTENIILAEYFIILQNLLQKNPNNIDFYNFIKKMANFLSEIQCNITYQFQSKQLKEHINYIFVNDEKSLINFLNDYKDECLNYFRCQIYNTMSEDDQDIYSEYILNYKLVNILPDFFEDFLRGKIAQFLQTYISGKLLIYNYKDKQIQEQKLNSSTVYYNSEIIFCDLENSIVIPDIWSADLPPFPKRQEIFLEENKTQTIYKSNSKIPPKELKDLYQDFLKENKETEKMLLECIYADSMMKLFTRANIVSLRIDSIFARNQLAECKKEANFDDKTIIDRCAIMIHYVYNEFVEETNNEKLQLKKEITDLSQKLKKQNEEIQSLKQNNQEQNQNISNLNQKISNLQQDIQSLKIESENQINQLQNVIQELESSREQENNQIFQNIKDFIESEPSFESNLNNQFEYQIKSDPEFQGPQVVESLINLTKTLILTQARTSNNLKENIKQIPLEFAFSWSNALYNKVFDDEKTNNDIKNMQEGDKIFTLRDEKSQVEKSLSNDQDYGLETIRTMLKTRNSAIGNLITLMGT